MPIDPKTGEWPVDSETAECEACGEIFPCDNPEDRVYCSPQCSRAAFGANSAAGKIEHVRRHTYRTLNVEYDGGHCGSLLYPMEVNDA